MKGYDVLYKLVYFDSFRELVDLTREKREYKLAATLHYDGTDYAGCVTIEISVNHPEVRDEYLELAAKTLRVV